MNNKFSPSVYFLILCVVSVFMMIYCIATKQNTTNSMILLAQNTILFAIFSQSETYKH